MRLKKKYYRLLDDLANYSQDVVLESSFFGSSKLFDRIIEVHDDLSVPYSSLFSDLKFLFGSSSVVQSNLL